MTTETWSTRVRHDSDSEWQLWRDEVITKLGLMVAGGNLAADETNITAGVGARPGTNTEGGYAVYHLDDAMHATAPVYIRFGFRTMNGLNTPGIRVQVGTSTNGSGVLGGTALSTGTTEMHSANTGSGQTSNTARDSFMSCAPGFFGFSNKDGASEFDGFFQVSRTVDADGDIDARGVICSWGGSSSFGRTQALQFSPAAAYTFQTNVGAAALGFNPQASSTSVVGSDTQAFLAWTPVPEMAPVVGVCGVIAAELAKNNTFTFTPVGATPRTYLSLKDIAGAFGPLASAATGGMRYCMLWE